MITFRLILIASLLISVTQKSSGLANFSLDKNVRMPKLILLDRDGVLNEDVGAPGVLCPSQLMLTPCAGYAIGRLKRLGCKISMITNQSCVGKHLIAIEGLHKIHDRLQEMLLAEDMDATLDHIFYCTSLKNSGDVRMKPNPGMIEEAIDHFDIDASNCVMVGDALRDLQAAAAAGVSFRVLVETGYGRDIMKGKSAPLDSAEVVKDVTNYNVEENCTGEPTELPFLYAKNLNSTINWIISEANVE